MTMENTLGLVSALRLNTEFFAGGVKHNRRIPKKSGKSPIRIEEAPPIQVEENSPTEIEEIWDIEPSSIIGQGAFGIVRFERRRPLISDHSQTSHNQVRAVKEIKKLNTPDYMKELQAIAKFSQAQVSQIRSYP